MQELISRLQTARRELDHHRVSWVDKHLVIDLNQKATVLINSLIRFENNTPEQNEVIQSVKKFLIEVNPIIQHLNNQTGEIK